MGVLTFIDNTVDKATGTIQCKATFANAGQAPVAGLVRQRGGASSRQSPMPSWSRPRPSRPSQEGQFVCVVKPDLTVEVRPVEVERSVNGEVIVKKGLQPGERVVTDGQLRLVPGAKMEIKTGL